ncbi:YwmB family TATA-box binding protein [Paenibacillus glycanilyticus]|uniref:TATA-box binding protein n=1 Tax=Paenibacillus glycanilyticus TaxID=126569 RepID=A0ABQ6GCX8_9BACL|nr:YwmB family TATA-box binding protein [Paenibacillus glycanilyticus]GLX67487.1 hypothetical protein MU1_18320 [Paenibacillus glycanilyticus]
MATNRFMRRTEEETSLKRSRLAIILAGAVLVTGIIWAIANKDQIGSEHRSSVLAHDIALVWQWTDKLYSKGEASREWTIRWDVTGEAASLEEVEQQLHTDEKGLEQGTLSIFPLTADNQVMIVYVTKQQVDEKQLLAFINRAETLFKQSGTTYSAGMTVRGETEYNNAAARLAQAASGKRVDRYKDESGTTSEAYYTEKLFSSVEAGAGKKANLQIAVHRETESGALSLIVGIPLITGDYTVPETEND